MNFEGQNINLQDALFVDNITGSVEFYFCGQERAGMRHVRDSTVFSKLLMSQGIDLPAYVARDGIFKHLRSP